MKNTYLFLLFSLFLFSCSADDSANRFSEKELFGKWFLSGGSINGGAFQPYIHNCETNREFQEFLSNKELTLNKFNEACILNNPEVSNWELIGTKLIISNTNFDPINYNYTYEIIKLTDTELIIEMSSKSPDEMSVERMFLEE